MLFGQRPVSMFPGYTYRPEYSQPSLEERYYRQVAEDHNRRAEAAMRLAQQERERAAREREIQALRERQYQEELARRAHLRQNTRRPHSQFFGTPDFGSPQDFFGRPFEVQHPRARAFEDRRRRQSHTDDTESRRFSAFLDHLFQHQDEDAEEEVPVPKKVSETRFESDSLGDTNTSMKQARFDHTPPAARPRSQPPRPETTSKTSVPVTTPEDTHGNAAATEAPAASARSTAPPAPSTPNSHAASFSSLNAIQTQFDALKAAFSFPANAEFDSSSSSSDVPKLTYASVNAPVHQYENELVKLLTKLDAVESDGAESIRGARKALVIAVEKELTRLDEQKREAWAKSSPVEPEVASAASSESEPTAKPTMEEQAPAQEVQDSSAPQVSTAGETTSDAVVAAASIPLPESDDMELDVQAEPADAQPTESASEEVPVQVVPEIATPAVSTSQQPAEEAVTLDNDHSTASASTDLFADTPEALADPASEDEEEESSGEAGILVHEDSDSEVEAFIQVEEASPRISEAPLHNEGDVEDPQEEVKLPTREQADDEDDFEML
ncbi:hypothetical protein FS837_012267 [Tulasnella sp. UAMH 9824]|nr:hypothetical protein FS837_012267 [Tulasnella sp. UAMH 9824]